MMRDGKLIQFDVHHRVSLQAGGSNAIENLCLVGTSLHNAVFPKGDDPVINMMTTGEIRLIALPVLRADIQVIAAGLNARTLIDTINVKEPAA